MFEAQATHQPRGVRRHFHEWLNQLCGSSTSSRLCGETVKPMSLCAVLQ